MLRTAFAPNGGVSGLRLPSSGRRITIPAVLVEERMKFSQAANDCLLYLATVQKYSPKTIENYGLSCAQFVAYLRSSGKVDELEHFNVQTTMGFATYLGTHGVGSNTIANKLCALSAVARWLMKQVDSKGRPRLTMDPTKGFDAPRRVVPETKFLKPADLARFVAVDVYPYQAILRDLLLDTGIRASEACAANVGDLHEIDGSVSLHIQVKGRKQEGAAPAVVPLSADCAVRVRDSLLARGAIYPSEPLLVNARGARWNRTQLGECIAWIGKRAGITEYRVSPHKLRHTANVIATVAGIDAPTRAAMLNHRSQSTLARYDHLVPGAVQAAREKQRAAQQSYGGVLGQSMPATSPKSAET